jgi:hypothetical protein
MISSALTSGVVAALNFCVVGELRSGSSIVASALNKINDITCHLDLMHDDVRVRRAAHEDYFGSDANAPFLAHFQAGHNPYQYLNHRVFDNARNGERMVGLRMPYSQIRKLELCDLFEDKYREGDFCLIHVVRNPVACFLSLKQATRTRIWGRTKNDRDSGNLPAPVSVDPVELTRFCRDHAATRYRLKTACGDLCEVTYRSLFVDPLKVMEKVHSFLEIEDILPASSDFVRLRNRPIRDRIANLCSLRNNVPRDVLELIDDTNLF